MRPAIELRQFSLGFGLHLPPFLPLVPLLRLLHGSALPEPQGLQGDVLGPRVEGDLLAAQGIAEPGGASAEESHSGGVGALGDEVEAVVEEEGLAEEPDRPRPPPSPCVDLIDLRDEYASPVQGRENELEHPVPARRDEEFDIPADDEALEGRAQSAGLGLHDYGHGVAAQGEDRGDELDGPPVGGDGYGAAQAFASAGKPRPTIIMGNRQDELAWWGEQSKANGYKTMSASIAPGSSTFAFWVAQQILSGAKVPKDLSLPILTITQEQLAGALKSTEVGGVFNAEYSQKDVMDAIAKAK